MRFFAVSHDSLRNTAPDIPNPHDLDRTANSILDGLSSNTDDLHDALYDESWQSRAFFCAVFNVEQQSKTLPELPDLEVDYVGPNTAIWENGFWDSQKEYVDKVYLDKAPWPFHIGDELVYDRNLSSNKVDWDAPDGGPRDNCPKVDFGAPESTP